MSADHLIVCPTCGEKFPKNKLQPKQRYCGRSCAGIGTSITRRKNPLEKRFWAKVQKTESCWLWTASTARKGYGHIYCAGKYVTASILSWQLHFGPIPSGLFVCHNCPGGDNPACVNPAHLFLGTCKDNGQDAARKGRIPSVLTVDNVVEIRRLFGTVSQNSIAKKFGVSSRLIQKIVRRELWQHVT